MSASSSAPVDATQAQTHRVTQAQTHGVTQAQTHGVTQAQAHGVNCVSRRRYTRRELARHDGSDPNLAVLIAHDGKVYDVTASFPWAKGSHWGELRAGQDHTGHFRKTIHGEEMLSRVPCVGELVD
jgi:predicted heme/steroid binding protein